MIQSVQRSVAKAVTRATWGSAWACATQQHGAYKHGSLVRKLCAKDIRMTRRSAPQGSNLLLDILAAPPPGTVCRRGGTGLVHEVAHVAIQLDHQRFELL